MEGTSTMMGSMEGISDTTTEIAEVSGLCLEHQPCWSVSRLVLSIFRRRIRSYRYKLPRWFVCCNSADEALQWCRESKCLEQKT